jgi:hypothetical protein
MSLSLDDILGSNDKSVRKVACPEWGGECYVRTLTADERDRWELALSEGKKSVRASLVGVALCDEDGKPLNPTEAQIAGLGNKSAAPMDRLFDAIVELNVMRKQDVEKLEKNSEATADSD